ncbi:IS256 family transposase [Conexibacter sp. W3-3-2]|uniref:IS256 family transposase n=1 Tax=Conexibacter sp. W3-3-2 TaxID=2675227 RepID=UPI0012B78457|nr:IS256 family transposase [Conexibacter sp. W3-3-2]MTD43650.1 IS256 family transposase [Conexibacter sp. W3-3-2]MTD43651.1 IS256 family transposase [Conexibacter sp. W3-3-2]MTD44119.1 IS256 family transposase [Conexibacter sp. W3-3-2]MTD46246.1 IS256 family transposase [Conexibacter sp. W3-3-2]MTD46284.1 IS256 family transposase [Conexibacter sp. W3-3-2]
MAEDRMMTPADVVARAMSGEHGDLLRDAVALVVRELMEAEVAQLTGAGRGERSEDRVANLNGYRQRAWDTRVGSIELAIPRTRSGPSYFPSFLEPRSRCEQAIVSVVMEAYVNGVSTRKVDRLVEQLGIGAMSKDRVSRLCRDLDELVAEFRERELTDAYPYLWLDAKHVKVRERGRVVSKALVVAYAVNQDGVREVIGLDIGQVESGPFWVAFLRSLKARGLHGVQLAISDHHEGLKAAIAQVLDAPWQRCTVHFVRNMHGHCRRNERGLISAGLREVFQAADGTEARRRVGELLDRLAPVAPKVCELLDAAEEDLLAFYAFPKAHWSKLRSTNPLERVNKEIGRRSDVVGIFPNDASAIRLCGAVLIEQNDEWLTCRRYLSEESMAVVLAGPIEDADEVHDLEVASLAA